MTIRGAPKVFAGVSGLIVLAFLAMFGASFLPGCGTSEVRLRIVLTGLVNGNLLSFKERFGPDKGKMLGGMPSRNGVLKSIVAEGLDSGGHVFVIDTGDIISGTPEAYYTQGKGLIDASNPCPYDLMLLGNREFDFGREVLSLRAKEAKFPFLCTNIRNTDGTIPDFLVRSVVREAGGLKFGFVGFVPDDTPEMTPAKNIKGLVFEKSSNALRVALKDLKSDFTIVLTQIDHDREAKSLEALAMEGVDLMVATSFNRPCQVVSSAAGIPVARIFGYNQGSEITVLDFIVDPDKKTMALKGSRVVVVRRDEVESDSETSKLVAEYSRKIDSIMDRPLGSAADEITYEYDAESPLGNLITDVVRLEGEAELALQNPGGIKRALKKGVIKTRDMYDILPFDNEIVVMNLTGTQIRNLLTRSISKEFGLLQVSGLHYSFKTVDGKAVLEGVTVEGTPLNDVRVYKVATNSFLAGGGDKFADFKDGTDRQILGSLRAAVERWIEANSPVSRRAEGRILESK